MVSFAATQKQLLFKIVDDVRSGKKNTSPPKSPLSHQLFWYSAFKHWHGCFQSSSPLLLGLLWETIGKRVISKAANEKSLR